jgi:creatinine amidohydrolase
MPKRMARWTELTWAEIKDRKTHGIIGILPSGSVEQHGPHLPLATDVLIPEGLADTLAGRLEHDPLGARLVMLPPFHYTYARHSNWWPGTLNLDGRTLVSFTQAVLRDLFRQGVDQIMFVNGHMESVAFLMEGAELAVEDHHDARVAVVNWWELVADSVIDQVFGSAWPGWEAEHAALTETSLMLAFCPDLVHRDRIVDDREPRHYPYKVFPQPTEVRPPSGVYASAALASAEIGHRLAAHIVDGLISVIREQFGPG